MVLAGFSRHRLTDALNFVKKNADYSLETTDDACQRKLRITGVFHSQTFASTIEKELNLRSDWLNVPFLADRTAIHSMIGYWPNPVVRLSVCLCVTLCILALRVGVQG